LSLERCAVVAVAAAAADDDDDNDDIVLHWQVCCVRRGSSRRVRAIQAHVRLEVPVLVWHQVSSSVDVQQTVTANYASIVSCSYTLPSSCSNVRSVERFFGI